MRLYALQFAPAPREMVLNSPDPQFLWVSVCFQKHTGRFCVFPGQPREPSVTARTLQPPGLNLGLPADTSG